MIPDSMNAHDDMRGQRLCERAFEEGDHRAEDTGCRGGAKGKVRRWTAWIAALAWLLAATLNGADEQPAEMKWRVLLEPKSMHREVTWEIPGAQRTVFAPVVLERDE